MKTCNKCEASLDEASFNIDRSAPDGLRHRCIACVHASRDLDYDRRRMYGITRKDYEGLCNQQDRKCKVCGRVCKLYVDHNHKTSVIRGLLCNNCNLGLGHFKDNPQLLRNAANYLEAAPRKIDFARMFMRL